MASCTSNVCELQRVLTQYAKATGYTAADPGGVDGIVGIKTIMAVVAVVPQVPKMPSEVKAFVPVVTILLATTDGQAQAKKIITNNASYITKAILATAILSAATGTPNNNGGSQLPGVQIIPVGPTAGGGSPSAGGSIYFYDSKKRLYRIAVMRGLGGVTASWNWPPKIGVNYFAGAGLGAAYVEIQPSTTAPGGGVEVAKSTFLVQTGQWYATPIGIAGLVAGGSFLLGGASFVLARVFR